MEQKFKVGDLVRSKSEDWTKGMVGEVVGHMPPLNAVHFLEHGEAHDCEGILPQDSGWFLDDVFLELAYPSDHDLLDFAARDSMVAELKAENEALKAELEKYKPKPRRKTFKVVLIGYEDGRVDWFPESEIGRHEADIIARKTVTITEGEGM